MNNDARKTIAILILIILCIIAIVIIYKVIRHYLKHKTETITAFTGGLGSGKSCLGVDLAKSLLKKNRRKLRKCIKRRKRRNKWLFWLPRKNEVFEEPLLFSNIPIIIVKRNRVWQWIRVHIFRKERKQDIYSAQLTKDILLLQTSIPKGSVVFIDEIGTWASQFRFKDTNIIEVFDEYIRLFRHYWTIEDFNIEPYIVVNDQCSENINLVIRRRMNMIHNLSNFLLIWRLAFYYERIISISEEIKTIDMRTGVENDTQDNSNFRWKFIVSKGCYDSHCYSGRVKNLPRLPIKYYLDKKTNQLLRCPTDKEHLYHALTDDND